MKVKKKMESNMRSTEKGSDVNVKRKGTPQVKPGENRRHTRLTKNGSLLMLTMPMVLYTFIFAYIPMFGIIIAFKDFNYAKGIFGSEWVGFQNFRFFFTSPNALEITINTVGYNLVFIITGTVASVAVALLLYEISSRFLLKTYQTFMFLPNLLSWVVVAYMAYAFLNPRSGILDELFKTQTNWYAMPNAWIFILPLANLWKGLGMGALLYYANLMNIDKAYFEAAAIEGANKLQVTRHITLPFLYPLITMLTLLAIGGIFTSDFGLFFQLPMNSTLLYSTTDVLDTYVYRALAKLGNIDMSSAAGLYKSVVGFVLVVICNYAVKKYNPEYSLY